MAAPDAPQDIETVHGVFRAVHSIKGGGGAFGLTSLVEFAHVFETVLDQMRSGKLAIAPAAVQSLLRAFDVLSDLVAVAREGGAEPPKMAAVLMELDLLAEAAPAGAVEDDVLDFQPLPLDILALSGPNKSDVPEGAGFVITLAPKGAFYTCGHEPLALLRTLSRMGDARLCAEIADVARLSALDLAEPRLRWRMELATSAPREEIEAVFEFVDGLAEVTVEEIAAELVPQAEKAIPDKTVQDSATGAAAEPVALPLMPTVPPLAPVGMPIPPVMAEPPPSPSRHPSGSTSTVWIG